MVKVAKPEDVTKAVNILSLDAKDIYLTNHMVYPLEEGFDIHTNSGDINYNKFINTLDYSLDLIKLYEVYYKRYRRRGFSWNHEGKLYTQHMINVTFKYTVKEWNRIGKGIYILCGYNVRDMKFEDNLAFDGDKLVGINCGIPCAACRPDVLPPQFECVEGKYEVMKQFKTIYSVDDLRADLYENGFVCDGIKFVRWKRSSGSARVGKCLFINERLYSLMHKWEMCGLYVRNNQKIDLAALEAYISLPSSSIIDTMKIKPENILVIDDYDSKFSDKVVVTYNEDGKLKTKVDTIDISNSIWDGQSLIDSSMIDHGMVLLRNLFFKSCCFNCNIQQWFADNGITSVDQLNGKTIATDISQIKLITTPNSIKFLKFGTLDEWLAKIDEDFGIVKYDKKTKFFDGRMVQSHYQLINTLQLDKKQMQEFLKPSLEYIDRVKNDPGVLRYHINYTVSPFVSNYAKSKNDVIYKMLGLNEKFANTSLYKTFRSQQVVKPFLNNLRHGHVYINGNYSTLCGNPIEMLQATIGTFKGESVVGIGNVHTLRFEDGADILGSRSPHVCQGNIWVTKNKRNDLVSKYMNISTEIIVINSIGENILMRLSGADFDSDTVMITDNPILLKAAQKNYERFLVPTCAVEAQKVNRRYNNGDKCDLDIKTGKNLIGEIVNLSQELNSLLWDSVNTNDHNIDNDKLYLDICQLDVMSGIEIDKAKKEFDIDNLKELKAIRDKYKILDDETELVVRPYFFKFLSQQKGFFIEGKKCYKKHHTAMDYLAECIDEYNTRAIPTPRYKFSDVLAEPETRVVNQRRPNKNAKVIIDNLRQCQKDIIKIWKNKKYDYNLKSDLLYELQQKQVNIIQNLKLSKSTMYYLVNLIENEEYKDIRSLLFYGLFSTGNKSFYDLLEDNRDTIKILHEIQGGSIKLFDFEYDFLQF